MGSKGQITVFIILGIVLLGMFSLFLYMTGSMVEEQVTSASRDFVEDVPSEFIAIQTYTESCLETTAKEGLIILGQQGGYLYPTTVGEYSISDPTNSDGINLDPLIIPYWHYNSNPNGESSVAITSLQPSLDDEDDYYSIAAQLGRYVDEQIEDCLVGYAAFVEQEYIVEYDTKETSVRIFDGELDLTMQMPMTTSRGESTAEMSTFYTDVQLDLKSYYEIADQIAVAEYNYTFLEQHTLNLLATFSRTGDSEFPPTASTTIETYNTDMWITAQVRIALKELLNSYVPMLRYSGSANYYRHEYAVSDLSGLYQQVSDDMIIPLTHDDAVDYDIGFNYFGWDPYLSINGGEEQITPSQQKFGESNSLISWEFSMFDYLNIYDISYPVLVSITDEDAFYGEGYTFNFAMESNIVNNEPFEEDYAQPDTIYSAQGITACEEGQWGDAMLSTLVVDAYTHEPIEDVLLSFSIPSFTSCDIGLTNDRGELDSKYPSVVGGELELLKEGYLTQSLLMDTALFTEDFGVIGYAVAGMDDAVLEMYQLKAVNVSVKQRQINKCVSHIDLAYCMTKNNNNFEDCLDETLGRTCFFNSGQGLFLADQDPVFTALTNGSWSNYHEYYYTDNEKEFDLDLGNYEVIIMLERVSDVEGNIVGIEEESHFVIASYNGLEAAELELYPGQYKVTAYASLTFNDPYEIPEDIRCFSNDEEDCTTFDSSSMDKILLGQLFWDDEDSYLTITADDLYSFDTLELYILGYAWDSVPSTYTPSGLEIDINARMIEDIAILGVLADLSSNTSSMRQSLEPKWSSSIIE